MPALWARGRSMLTMAPPRELVEASGGAVQGLQGWTDNDPRSGEEVKASPETFLVHRCVVSWSGKQNAPWAKIARFATPHDVPVDMCRAPADGPRYTVSKLHPGLRLGRLLVAWEEIRSL